MKIEYWQFVRLENKWMNYFYTCMHLHQIYVGYFVDLQGERMASDKVYFSNK